jgi:hypothetical protein
MALELLKTPQGGSDAGMFNLPPTFDTQRYAAEWVLEDQVAFKQQRQTLPQTGYSADGWQVWKAETKDKPTVVAGSGNKKFVLMCRPLGVQKQVNALYGNVSKQLISREVRGETAAGEAVTDSGILTNDRLKSAIPGENSGDGELTLNEIPVLASDTDVTAAQST